MNFNTPQDLIVYIGRMLFERRLADFAGGNVSLRVEETLYISPRYSGARQHWNIDPQTIVSGPIATDEVLQHPQFSREGKAHLAVYRAFPEARAIIHSHPFHVMPFCAAELSIPPVLESTDKFGLVEATTYAPAHSQELADNIVRTLSKSRERITKQAAAVLLPRHGIFVVSHDMLMCLDAVERIDWNAWCILAQKLMPE